MVGAVRRGHHVGTWSSTGALQCTAVRTAMLAHLGAIGQAALVVHADGVPGFGLDLALLGLVLDACAGPTGRPGRGIRSQCMQMPGAQWTCQLRRERPVHRACNHNPPISRALASRSLAARAPTRMVPAITTASRHRRVILKSRAAQRSAVIWGDAHTRCDHMLAQDLTPTWSTNRPFMEARMHVQERWCPVTEEDCACQWQSVVVDLA